MVRIVWTDFFALCLFCFNIGYASTAVKSYILSGLPQSSLFVEGRTLCTVGLMPEGRYFADHTLFVHAATLLL